MSSDIAVRVDDLSKRYRIGKQSIAYLTLRETIMQALKAPFRRDSNDDEEFIWALKDVSFEIKKGETIGIIGCNGAGKSTLLKILARITKPTRGRAEIHGRVGSLLEVGTGFHHELTGRENIYLSGAILGMKRREIDRKFDEIVAFSEVDKFLDTPAKHYSSGIYMRLAFAVAAHLEPDILLVDEVLAVGDAAFQKKCVNRMSEISSTGRTVLFVSHNMGLVQSLCPRAILLKSGVLHRDGPSSDIISAYLSEDVSVQNYVDLTNHPNRQGMPGWGIQGVMHKVLTSARLLNQKNEPANSFFQSEPLKLCVDYDGSKLDTPLAGVGFVIYSSVGVRVGSFNTYMTSQPPHRINQSGRVTFTILEPTLAPGIYTISLSIGDHQTHHVDKIENVLQFSIMQEDIYKTGYLLAQRDGVIAFECDVQFQK